MKWIKATDRLPQYNELVLIYCDKEFQCIEENILPVSFRAADDQEPDHFRCFNGDCWCTYYVDEIQFWSPWPIKGDE
jgi:hypothetical protein